VAQRLHPRRGERAEQEISDGHDEVGGHEGAAESEAVGESAAENRKEPDDEAEGADEPAGEFAREVELFVEINREDCGGAVVGDALEDFREVGDPEGGLEAFVSETFGATWGFFNKSCAQLILMRWQKAGQRK
jgi:hypothetical protein